MDSLEFSSNGVEKEQVNGQVNLQTINDVLSLDMSDSLMQAVDEGLLAIEPQNETKGVIHVPICLQHQLVILPMCPMCLP